MEQKRQQRNQNHPAAMSGERAQPPRNERPKKDQGSKNSKRHRAHYSTDAPAAAIGARVESLLRKADDAHVPSNFARKVESSRRAPHAHGIAVGTPCRALP